MWKVSKNVVVLDSLIIQFLYLNFQGFITNLFFLDVFQINIHIQRWTNIFQKAFLREVGKMFVHANVANQGNLDLKSDCWIGILLILGDISSCRMGWFCSSCVWTWSFIIVDSVPVDDDTSFERSEGDSSEGDCQNLLRGSSHVFSRILNLRIFLRNFMFHSL